MLSNEIGLETAYQTVASSCFDVMFQRAEKYHKHPDHTVENLVLRVKEFNTERQKAEDSEREFETNPYSSAFYRRRPFWDEDVFEGDYYYARYESLCQELKNAGVRRVEEMYFPEFVYDYINLQETCIEMDEVIARVLLHQALEKYSEYSDGYEDSALEQNYTEKIIQKKYKRHLSWIKAGTIVSKSKKLKNEAMGFDDGSD